MTLLTRAPHACTMWACFTPPSPPSHLEYERSTLPSRSPPPPSLKTPIRGQRSSSLVSTSVALMKDSKHICKVSTVPPRARASALGQIDKRPRLPYYHRAPTSTRVPAHLDSHTRTLAHSRVPTPSPPPFPPHRTPPDRSSMLQPRTQGPNDFNTGQRQVPLLSRGDGPAFQ